jgi:hypothetical protein
MQFAIGVIVLECSFVKHSHGPLGVKIGVSFHYYSWLVLCGIKVEVAQGINFLQVVNITLYATTMDFSNYLTLKNHNSHMHTYFSFLFFTKLFISNC